MNYQEFKNILYGQHVVVIQYCSECKQHNQSLRHDEKKYLQISQQIQERIYEEFPCMIVYLKPFSLKNRSEMNQLGCLEVFYSSYKEKEAFLVASKLKTLKWPNVETVILNIQNFLEGQQVNIQVNSNIKNEFLKQSKFFFCFRKNKEKVISEFNKKNINKSKSSKPKQSAVKPRQVYSNIIERQIASGYIKKEELEKLQNKEYFYQVKQINKDNQIQIGNLKPGKYSLVLLENKYFEQQFIDFDIQGHQEHNDLVMNIKEKMFSSIQINIHYNIATPLRKIQFFQQNNLEIKEDKFEQNNEGQIVNSLFQFDYYTDLIIIAQFQISQDKFIKQAFELFNGENLINISIMENQEIKVEVKNFQSKTEQKTQENASDIQYVQSNNNSIINTKQNKTVNNNQQSSKHEDIQIKEQKEEKQTSQHQLLNQSQQKLKSNQNILSNANLLQQEEHKNNQEKTNIQQEQENQYNNKTNEDQITQNQQVIKTSQQQIQNTSLQNLQENHDQKETKKEEDFFESFEESLDEKLSSHSLKQEETQTQIPRIQSVNKIRPGERIPSSKSLQQIVEIKEQQQLEEVAYVQEKKINSITDKVFEEIQQQKEDLILYVKKSPLYQFNYYIHSQITKDKLISQGKIQVINNDQYEIIIFRYFEELKFIWFQLSLLQKNSQEKLENIYAQTQDQIHIINLQHFIQDNQILKQNHLEIGVAFKGVFQDLCFFPSLIFLKEIKNPFLGLKDISTLVEFVNNSKFHLSQFFGFEQQNPSRDQDQDFLVTFEQAKESLQNFEIKLEGNYLFDFVWFNKEEKISLKKLEQQYPIWLEINNCILDNNIFENIEQIDDEYRDSLHEIN